jgi:hypothetical protein
MSARRYAVAFVVGGFLAACSSDAPTAGDASVPDGAASDAAASSDAGVDAAACFAPDGGTIERFKACQDDPSCVIVTRVPCCGPEYAVGINHSFMDSFSACESALEASCAPGRGCANGPTFAEDGKSADITIIGVRCADGLCATFVP